METKSTSLARTIKEYFVITLGLAVYALSWTIFIIPNNLVGGGVTGIGAIIQYCTGFNVSYSFFIINAFLLLIGLKVLGKAFGMKTIYAIIAVTVLLRVMPMVIPQDFIDAFAGQENGKLLCTIVGGMLIGSGIATAFMQGGSTGGTDIIALMINKYHSITPGKILAVLDIIIITSSLIIPSDGGMGARVATVFYGYILAGVSSVTLDLSLSGSKQSVQIFIFSKKYSEIADRVLAETHHGLTILSGQGWYTKDDVKLAMVVVRKTQSSEILRIVKQVDDTAFVSVCSVMGVYGRGFDKIKN